MNKLCNYDRLMILAHKPEFRKQLIQINEGIYRSSTKILIEKWDLEPAYFKACQELLEQVDALLDAKDHYSFARRVSKMHIFRNSIAAQPAPKKLRPKKPIVTTSEVAQAEELFDGETVKVIRRLSGMRSKNFRGGRYLLLRLDLLADQSQILEEMEKCISEFQTINVEKQPTLSLDPWVIYRWYAVYKRPVKIIVENIIRSTPGSFKGEDCIVQAEKVVRQAINSTRNLLKSCA